MNSGEPSDKPAVLHASVLLLLLALHFMLPAYHHAVLSRIMVLAVFAMGYNLLFGYTGLLSLGHAMFFAAGLYGAGLPVYHLEWSVPAGFAAGVGAGALLSLAIGFLALRTTGVAFMIVTLMFAQVLFLLTYYFAEWTGGDDGLVLSSTARSFAVAGYAFDLSRPDTRYLFALGLFAVVLTATLLIVRSPYGRVLVAIRENEARTRMLGYNTFANKLTAVVASGIICAAAGAAYGLLFGYVGATLASIQYSILPLLWVLLGGAATTLGPLLGTLLMYYMTDVASQFTSAYLLVVGALLIILMLGFRKGILGTIRAVWLPWLP